LLSVANIELQGVADAYRRNMNRVNYLILFPPAAVQIAIQVQRATDEVDAMRPRPSKADHTTIVGKIFERNANTVKSASAEIQQKYIDSMGAAAFAILDRLADDEGISGLEAWLAAQITTTWTAFEGMAGDLWEAALNFKPRELASLSGVKQIPENKKIDLNFIQKYNFDLSKYMGTIFIESNKYSFDKLDSMRTAYKDAFGDHLNDIMSNPALDAIATVRNNLVHKGGIIDDKYLRRKSVLPPERSAMLVLLSN
jgi:hypothetical protein